MKKKWIGIRKGENGDGSVNQKKKGGMLKGVWGCYSVVLKKKGLKKKRGDFLVWLAGCAACLSRAVWLKV